ncbi:hypothetical protein ACPYO6_01365 [Georgenia sp. Z1344]|uniref:hypothetical protein n=1 Tax=Georgenia sp. Z1344 TaxID=3416706 RepID=UPI003CF35ADB
MTDEIEIDETTMTTLKDRHVGIVDDHAAIEDPVEGDFGWGAEHVSGIVARTSDWLGRSTSHNGKVALLLQDVWDRFQNDDDGAAALFDQAI